MRNIACMSVFVLCIASFTGCGSDENSAAKCEPGNGTIAVENTSADVYDVKIDGNVMAKLYPGDEQDIKVPAGEHSLEYAGNGSGCSLITIFIDSCETETWCCPECSSNGSGSNTATCPAGYPIDCGTGCCPVGTYCCGLSCCSY